MQWLLDRLNEPSTWRGIVGVITSAGVVLQPELADKIIAAGLALMGVVNVIRKEKKPEVKGEQK